jgi:hypothetical protein
MTIRALLMPLALATGCLVSPDPALYQGRDGQADRSREDVTPDLSGSDGRTSDVRQPDSITACDWSGTVQLSAPVPLDAVNSASSEIEPMLSADGLTLYFASNRDGGYDSYTATRASRTDAFGNVAKNLEVSTDTDAETRLALTSDGLEAFLATTRPGGEGAADIWVATRASTGAPFSPTSFQPLDVLNSDLNEWDPYPSADGLRLYYIVQNWPSGLGNSDIVVASRTTPHGTFSAPVAVAGVNSSEVDDNPAVTADERVMLLGSGRTGGLGGRDIYYAVRPDAQAAFSTPVPLPGINTADNDSEIYITPDGCEVYFASDRPGGQGSWDLYHAVLSP